MSEVASDGEVNSKALPGAKTWHDFVYGCSHCELKFETLNMLLSHFRNDVQASSMKSYEIKCPECWGVFFRPQYINHALKHHPNLMFTCIVCSKIFQNSVALLKHYHDQHGESSQTDVCFCIQCGLYFSNVRSLKAHKIKEHKMKVPAEVSETRVLRKSAKIKKTSLRKTRGRPKGSTKNLLICRRDSLKRLAEYQMRKDQKKDNNCETSFRNPSLSEIFPEKCDNSMDEPKESKKSSEEWPESLQISDKLSQNHQKEGINYEKLTANGKRSASSSANIENTRLSSDKKSVKIKSQDEYSKNIENSSTKSEESSNKRKCSEVNNENPAKNILNKFKTSEDIELNSYDNEKRFLTPSKFFIAPRSKKPENSRSLSPNYEKQEDTDLNCKINYSLEFGKTKRFRPCPLSKKPKSFQDSHESSSTDSLPSETSFNYENFSNTLTPMTEFNPEPKSEKPEKISDLIKRKVISNNVIKHNGKYLVQRVGDRSDSAWFWLEDVEEVENEKELKEKYQKSNVVAKITKRRLTNVS